MVWGTNIMQMPYEFDVLCSACSEISKRTTVCLPCNNSYNTGLQCTLQSLCGV